METKAVCVLQQKILQRFVSSIESIFESLSAIYLISHHTQNIVTLSTFYFIGSSPSFRKC